MNNRSKEIEQVCLYRGGSTVTTLLGAFGRQVKETRLTAYLGFLIAQRLEAFRELLGFDGQPNSVELETTEDGGRTDIVIETSKGRCVVEAKIGATDSSLQASRYAGRWHVILSALPDQVVRGKGRSVRYVSWQVLAKALRSVGNRSGQPFKGYCLELVRHLEEHGMIRTEPVEIYAREINNENTLKLFLHARLYTCLFERGSRLAESMYFAPHFGARIANDHPGICQGISFIAKLENVEVVDSWDNLRATLERARGRRWYRQNKVLLEGWRPTANSSLREEWRKDKKVRSILFLGEPRLVFNPPIKKDNLQKGKGWLSKRFFSFDELFKAWS